MPSPWNGADQISVAIRSMDMVLPTQFGPEIRTRCISIPTGHQQIFLEKLRLKLPSKIAERRMSWKFLSGTCGIGCVSETS
jgi:hypothetical protein